MTVRSRDLAVAFFASALMTMALSFALTTERASAFIVQPPNEVTILHVEWDRAEVAPGVISEGVQPLFPDSAFTEVSGKASDFFKQASYGVFGGWNTRFAGTFKIAAPRLPSGQGGHSQPCDAQFFNDITSRADNAALNKGINPGSATLYYFDEKLCAQMPDAGAEAALSVGVERKAVMQVTRETGPTRHELVHAIGHFMRLQHADSLNCTSEGARVPFSDNCTVEASGDAYDSMGEGTGTFSVGAIKALGWLKDEQHKEVVAPNNDVRQTYALGTITDGGSATPLPTRAIRFTDGGTTFWVEYRGRTGIDVTEPPFPSQGGIGVILHKEIRPPFGREPIFQLIDTSPSTPRSDAGLRLPTHSWTNPLGRIKINFVNFTNGGAFVSIGPKPGAAPLPTPTPTPEPTPTEPTIPNPSGPTALVVQVGWQGQDGGTKATDAFTASNRLAEASQLASNWFEEVSGGRKRWRSTYGGEITIPAPRTGFLGAGQPNSCTEDTFKDITEAADAVVRERRSNSSLFSPVVYVFNGTVCQQMPEVRGTAIVAADDTPFDRRRVVVQATDANFSTPLAGSRAIVEAQGHALNLSHSSAIDCVDHGGAPIPLSFHCASAIDPYDVMGIGGGGGSFSAGELASLGWLSTTSNGSEAESWFNTPNGPVTSTIAPLTAAPGRPAPFNVRGIRLGEGSGTGLWVEYRQPIGVDGPARSGSGAVLGLLVYREVRANDGERSFQLLDMSPGDPISNATLPVGADRVAGVWRIKLESADQNGARVTFERDRTQVGLPEELPHPVPPENPGPRSLLVLNVGWDRPDPEDAAPLQPGSVDRIAYMINHQVNDWYERSAPIGRYEDWEAFSGGSVKIRLESNVFIGNGLPEGRTPFNVADCDSNFDRFEFSKVLSEEADAYSEFRGLDPDDFGHVVYVFDHDVCGRGGYSHGLFSNHSTMIGRPDASLHLLNHELGHHLNIEHSETLTCLNSALRFTSFSNNCTSTEYGDPADVMGSGTGAFNAAFANSIGWLDHQFVGLEEGDYTKTIHLQPWVGEEPPIEGFVRAIRLIDGGETFWMEYRTQSGPDADTGEGEAPPPPGLYIHRQLIWDRVPWPLTGRIEGTPRPQLIDTTPDGQFFNAALTPGRTWVNPLGHMEIKLTGGDENGAIVTISRKRSNVPVPDLRGDTTGEARAAIEAVGLVYGGSSGSVDDCTGSLYGRVVAQAPVRNQQVALDSEVTVTLGQKPKFAGHCQ